MHLNRDLMDEQAFKGGIEADAEVLGGLVLMGRMVPEFEGCVQVAMRLAHHEALQFEDADDGEEWRQTIDLIGQWAYTGKGKVKWAFLNAVSIQFGKKPNTAVNRDRSCHEMGELLQLRKVILANPQFGVLGRLTLQYMDDITQPRYFAKPIDKSTVGPVLEMLAASQGPEEEAQLVAKLLSDPSMTDSEAQKQFQCDELLKLERSSRIAGVERETYERDLKVHVYRLLKVVCILKGSKFLWKRVLPTTEPIRIMVNVIRGSLLVNDAVHERIQELFPSSLSTALLKTVGYN